MPLISFVKNNKNPLQVNPGENLMKALTQSQIPVASSCGGDAVCAKCKIRIVSGLENLSPETEIEKSLRASQNISDDFRISCQTHVLGELLIDASYW